MLEHLLIMSTERSSTTEDLGVRFSFITFSASVEVFKDLGTITELNAN